MAPKDKFADRGSERMILSLALREPDLLIDISTKLQESDFLSSSHRALFSILKSLYEAGAKSFDLMGVVNEAMNKNMAELVGGADYVGALLSNPVNKDNTHLYINKVLECSTKYKLYQETEHIQENILSNLGTSENHLPSSELIAQSESRILTISMESNQVEDAVDISTGLRELLEDKAKSPVQVLGLSTGIELLDKAINGLMPGSLTVLAARAKHGKSTLMLNMAAYVSYVIGMPVLFIDTELPRQEFQMRSVSHMSRVPERLVTNGRFIENDMYTGNIWRAASVIEKGHLYHKYMPGFTMDAVKSTTRKFHAREGIGALFFDYIKMPESASSGNMKEHQLLGNIATGLKDLAGILNIPVVAAAQIKRGESANPKTRYHDSDVADSDRIGRYCNNLLAIGKKSRKEQEEDGMTCGTHRLQILLARSGTPNYHGIDLSCDFPTYSMRQAEHQSYQLDSFTNPGGLS